MTLRVNSTVANVILADSNFRYWQPEDESYEAHVFPGAHLSHAIRMLETAKLPDTVRNLIICVGINNRDWELTSTAIDLRKLATAAEKLKQKVYFLGVSSPRLPDRNENDNIIRLNHDARERFGGRFIPPLPQDEVRIRRGDSYGIHHDDETVRRVFSSIIAAVHLN